MARPHWQNCIAHFDDAVADFTAEYFDDQNRRCLVVAAAGFDPRSRHVSTLLAASLGDRLIGLFIREERGTPDASLVDAADTNANALSDVVPINSVVAVNIFGNDNAPIAGSQIAAILGGYVIPSDITDIILDMTALSIGVGFPAARLLLKYCEERGIAFHIMIASNPELDDEIASEPGDRPMAVRGFVGPDHSGSSEEVARIWVPLLAKGRAAALDNIGRSVGETYKICPVVPFPSRDPRRADSLITEYETQLVDEWQVDPRDLVYVSERNPLDCYRILSTLKMRYDQTMAGVFTPSIVLSPVGSRVMATGAWMAAVEHDFPVQYIETVRYDFDPAKAGVVAGPDLIVHLLLSGPAYRELESVAPAADNQPSEDGGIG